ncbi:hypothetical protein [Streptomyces sp. NPDC004763]
MISSAPRSTWTTDTIRAADLTGGDAALIKGKWREVLDVWQAGDDPAAEFGEDSETTRAILNMTAWETPCWIGVRYLDEGMSDADSVRGSMTFLRLVDLVQVQREIKPAAPGGILTGSLACLGSEGIRSVLHAAVELYHAYGDRDDVLGTAQVDRITRLAEHFD